MARTTRRKHYVPEWVTRDFVRIDDPHHGRMWTWITLEGEARAKQLRWWHEDKKANWGARPPKPFRMEHEAQHRSDSRQQLARWAREPDFEVQIRRKPVLPYWD